MTPYEQLLAACKIYHAYESSRTQKHTAYCTILRHITRQNLSKEDREAMEAWDALNDEYAETIDTFLMDTGRV